ncbi:MAG: hypothetical protein ACM3NQ_22495 [Bacteroidales bacterium]
MSPKSAIHLDAELDQLFQVPLDDFVRARNDLATRLRGDGRADDAMRVQAIAKPPLSAWATNQLYWRARSEFDALMAAGLELREAQQASLRGRAADVRDADRARDRALAAALQRTLSLVADAGHPATPAMRMRMATNLEALAAYGGSPPGAVPGRMTDDLDAPGFEVFQAIAPGAGGAAKPAKPRATKRPAKIVSFEAIAGARRAVADAERAATAHRTEMHHAEAELQRVLDAAKEAEAEVVRAKRALEKAEETAERIRREVPRHEQRVSLAKAKAADAFAAVERARAALEEARKRR